MTDNHDALNQFLDNLATGAAPISSHLATESIATIHHITGLWQNPTPSDDFADRLEERLMNSGTHHLVALTPHFPGTGGDPSGVATNERPHPATVLRRWLPMLVSAALLLLTLGLAWRQFGPGADDRNSHTAAPSINAPATPSPVATPGDIVLELILPADTLPEGDGVAADLSYLTIPAGNRSTWTSRCCGGPIIEYVVSGHYTVTASTDIEVIRAGGGVEQVPANTAVTMVPGDSLIARNEIELEAENNGTDSADLVQWTLVDDGGDAGNFRGHILPGWVLRGEADVQGPLPLQNSPASVQLRAVIVRSGDVIAPPLNGLAFLVGTNVYADDEHVANRTIHLMGGEESQTAFVLTMTQSGTGGDATTSNAPRDDQLVQATLPVDELPTTDRVRTVFDHLWIPPGSTTGGSSTCCSGPMLEYVIAGVYTVRAAAAIEVIRANGAVEQVPANAGVTLGPGDSLISRSETAVQITVGGGVPAELLNWVLVDHSPDPVLSEEHVRQGWIVTRDDRKNPLSSVPPYPLTVQIRRVVIPNGDGIAAPAEGDLQFVLPDGIARTSEAMDGSTLVFKGDGGAWATAYVLTMSQPGAPPGTPAP